MHFSLKIDTGQDRLSLYVAGAISRNAYPRSRTSGVCCASPASRPTSSRRSSAATSPVGSASKNSARTCRRPGGSSGEGGPCGPLTAIDSGQPHHGYGASALVDKPPAARQLSFAPALTAWTSTCAPMISKRTRTSSASRSPFSAASQSSFWQVSSGKAGR